MSGRNGRALSVRKTEAIVSYQHRKKASILSRHTRDRGCSVSAVVLRRRSSRHLPDGGRHRKAEKYDPVEKIHLLLGDIPTFWT